MKTLNVIAVVESAILNQAVVVSYEDLQLSVVANATVENAGENTVVIGTPMAKYFGTEMRMHPVARASNGRFVSLAHVEDEVVDAALEYGADLLGFTLDSDEDSQSDLIVTDSLNLNTKEEEEVITVTEESVEEMSIFVPEPIIVNEKPVVQTATRLNGGFNIPVVNFEFKKIDLAIAMEEVIEPQPDLSTLVPVDAFDPMDQAMMEYHATQMDMDLDYDLGSDVIPFFGADMSHTDVQVEEVKPMSKLDIINETLATTYRYFRDNCLLKSFNLEQVRQQFAIIYRKHLVNLHSESELVGGIIKHIIESITAKYGKRTYVYKEVFMGMLTDIFKDIKAKSAKKYAA